MDLQLKNRKALVTGSTAGIGFAIASLLAEEGAAVVVSGRSQERVDAAVKKIRQGATNAVCDPGGSGGDGGVCVQPTGLGHQRGGAPCGWRRDPVHCLRENE
jgi:NAD(P)-dependent dehydrogenase (short-subunit alcohol dehydrogenase family)